MLRALGANDERIIEYFRAKSEGRKPSGAVVEIDIDETIASKIDLKTFAETIELKAWSRLARLSWKSYDEAVTFVHALGLQSETEWRIYLKGERPGLPKKPSDVPAAPARVYGDEFRDRGGWGAWLGTANMSRDRQKTR